jgi:hypothetical protein
VRGGTLFWTDGVATSKFECAVKTHKVSTTINCKAYYKIDYCNLRVITQSAVDTPDNVL